MSSPLLNREPAQWQQLGALHTAEEIAQQPRLWRQLAQALPVWQPALNDFLGDALRRPEQRVILTGAGSSAYIGELLAERLDAAWPAEVRAIATTSLLTHPELYLQPERPTLLVSFARSGNSPESLAAVRLAQARLPRLSLLHISCNPTGELLRSELGVPTHRLLMPAGSCDRGFAMTSSLSCMLLAALALLSPEPDATRQLQRLADAAEQALADWPLPLRALARQPWQRLVMLGSGPLEALAREAALKLLELTRGRVLALAHTPLAFRHGPKSMLDPASAVWVFRSAGAAARRYEQDLLDELKRDGVAGQVLSLGGEGSALPLAFDAGLPEAWAAPLWLLAAQLYALERSIALGYSPDNPFPDGTVNRVVQGVTIYPPPEAAQEAASPPGGQRQWPGEAGSTALA